MSDPIQPTLIPDGFYRFPDGGYLRLSGEDRRAFLQRQTTNHIDLLQPERSRLTVLTSATARILDVFILVDEGDEIGILTLPGRGAATWKYLRSRIFFKDRVSIEDHSHATLQMDLFGPRAAAALETSGVDQSLEANQVLHTPDGLYCIRLERSFGPGYRLLMPSALAEKTEAALDAAGLQHFTTEAYNRLRVEQGLPSAGRELTEDYTPLEAGLLIAVSDSKGCYTGQEVIARQINYDKITRLLCGLHLSGLAGPGSELFSQDGAPAGRLTSVADSPLFGVIGLGIVKRPYHQSGSLLRAGASGDSGVVVRVSQLPFQS